MNKFLSKIFMATALASLMLAGGLLLVPKSQKIDATKGSGQSVCPDGNGWTKIENNRSKSKITYNAPKGYHVEDVCIKGGSDKSDNGYLEYFSDNGWFTVNFTPKKSSDEITKNCVGAFGIGNRKAVARHGDAPGFVCAGISHASFYIAKNNNGCDDECHGDECDQEEDVCSNIDGVQTELPDGYEYNDNDECVKIEDECQGDECECDGDCNQEEMCEWNPQIPADSEQCVPPCEGDDCNPVEPTPTPTPTPNPLFVELRKSELTCTKSWFELTYEIKENGVGVKDVKVSFKYRNDTKEATTDDAGEAKVTFNYEGFGQVYASANGYPTKDLYIENLICNVNSNTPSEDGQVLGATTDGQVLGAYADAGVVEDTLMQVTGVFGYWLTGTGSIMLLGKKRSK